MSLDSARDPYLGLREVIREQARQQAPPGLLTGKVLCVDPLTVRAAGLNLTGDDLRLAQHLTPAWPARLAGGLSWPVQSTLPQQTLTGSCKVTVNGTEYTGIASVICPQEVLTGNTALPPVATYAPLAAGDEVLLLPDSEGQVYYLIERMVRP